MPTPTQLPRGEGLVAGLDLGGTKILGQVFDPKNPQVALVSHRVNTPSGAKGIIDAMAQLVSSLRAEVADKDDRPLVAVGTGVAGLVDHEGVIRFAPNLPGVVDLDVREKLSHAIGLPVIVDNDANTATVAEHRLGAGRGADDVVLVTLGTGIGGGVIVAGELQRGFAGFAGEPGHMVVDRHGPPCPCGRRGCWERFASGSGLGRIARDAATAGNADTIVARAGGDVDAVRGEHVTAAAAEGEPEALALMSEFGWWVALGVSNLENLLDPEVIIIGGGLADAGELLLAPTRAAYATLVLAYEHRPPSRIVGAELGADAGAIGAGMLAADLLVRD
ncbi:MAG: ROK family protein [Actinomycetes bacterium]